MAEPVAETIPDILPEDTLEILPPAPRRRKRENAVVCLCCERVSQPMDDDGCGICDECLGLCG